MSLITRPRAWRRAPDSEFLQGIRAGEAALRDPRRLADLAIQVHADAVVCSDPPEPSLIEYFVGRGLVVVYRRTRYSPAGALRLGPAPFRHLVRGPERFCTREAWAAAAASMLYKATHISDVIGVCLADAELLLSDPGGVLAWHIACCYRRILPGAEIVRLAHGDTAIRIPVCTTLEARLLSGFEYHWVLLDGARVVSRGRATGEDDPPGIPLNTRVFPHPDTISNEPRLRIHCFAPAPSAPFEASAGAGDVMVLRRRPPPPAAVDPAPGAPIQIRGTGAEISRFEVGVRFKPLIEFALERRPRRATWPAGGSVQAAAWNLGGDSLSGELRLNLHRSGGGSRSLLVSTVSLPVGSGFTSRIGIEAEWLAPGANYVMAGLRTEAGINLKTVLLYRPVGSRAAIFCSASKKPVKFWMPAPGASAPVQVSLDGLEERVVEFSPEPAAPPQTPTAPDWLAGWITAKHQAIGVTDHQGTPRPFRIDVMGGWDGGWAPEPGRGGNVLGIKFLPDGLVWFRWIPEPRKGNSIPRHWLTIPLDPVWKMDRVRWERHARWDCYPTDHPDAPRGDLGLPLQISRVLRAVLAGAGSAFAILTAAYPLDLDLRPDAIRIAFPAPAHGGPGPNVPLEFGFYGVPDADAAEGLWLTAPACVTRTWVTPGE